MKYLSFFLVVFASFKVHGQQTSTIHGTVKASDTGRPLQGASVTIVGTNVSTKTDDNGDFSLVAGTLSGTLMVSNVGYNTREETFDLTDDNRYVITLVPQSKIVDEVQVVGYGQTSRRYNTGSVSTISAAEIEKQPVTNVLSALSGRMPGVFVQTTNGLPGGNINIQIRGTNSISAGRNPLYVVDGVPYNSTFGTLTSTSTLANAAINGMVSPLNSLNPNDIESINILKDADATAIYGSRGSNGVVLITTKKANIENTRIEVDLSTAISKAANLPKLLNPEQYFMLREEAFSNNGVTPSSDPSSQYYAPELTVWDRNDTRDWADYLLGGTGNTYNIQSSISGGNQQTTYRISGNFWQESTYLPGDTRYKRGSLNANIQHRSKNERLFLQFSNLYTSDDNRLVNGSQNITSYLLLPPNYPLRNIDASFNWRSSNPEAGLMQYTKSKTNNLITNLLLRYSITGDIGVSVSAGYNTNSLLQRQVYPEISLYPGSINYTVFGNNGGNSFIVEPQFNYSKSFGQSKFAVLIGGTYQNTQSNGEYIRADNFVHSALMENLSSASNYSASNSLTKYKYASAFSRITYDYQGKYIVNASVRRDASSKFGPNKRIGHFGAIGAAWLFGEEKFVKRTLPFISYGKLRGSLGTTGNDQISDYQYLSTYRSSGRIYNGIPTLSPERIANNDFQWETTRKIEMALEVGLMQDRVLFSVNRYYNTSTNQLVTYAIPRISGFSGYQANLPAKIDNKGWEFEVISKNIESRNFNWITNFNITLPKNVLREFKDLSTSSYANTLVIGEDINRIYGYRFLRLDDDGVPLYLTKAGEETLSPSFQTDSYLTIGTPTPKFYGGIGNSVSFKNWTLDVFGQFSKQAAEGSLNSNFIPGSYQNNYVVALDRWTESNRDTNIPKASTSRYPQYWRSSANIFDASYLRLKNISLSYTVSNQFLQRTKIDRLIVYFQAQNIFTIWNNESALLDPESGGLSSTIKNLPPTRTFQLGLKVSL